MLIFPQHTFSSLSGRASCCNKQLLGPIKCLPACPLCFDWGLFSNSLSETQVGGGFILTYASLITAMVRWEQAESQIGLHRFFQKQHWLTSPGQSHLSTSKFKEDGRYKLTQCPEVRKLKILDE